MVLMLSIVKITLSISAQRKFIFLLHKSFQECSEIALTCHLWNARCQVTECTVQLKRVLVVASLSMLLIGQLKIHHSEQ